MSEPNVEDEKEEALREAIEVVVDARVELQSIREALEEK